MTPRFSVKSKDETLADFVRTNMQPYVKTSTKHFGLYDVEGDAWVALRDMVKEGSLKAHHSVFGRWGKRSVFRTWFDRDGGRYLCGAVITRRADIVRPDVVWEDWAMRCNVAALIGKDEKVDLVDQTIANGYLEKAHSGFVHTMAFLLTALLDRPVEFKQSRGMRTNRERLHNTPAVVTISLSEPIIRTDHGATLGGGWKMPEHDVRGHERRLKSGKTVWVSGHKRGDPNVERRTTYRIVP